MSQNTPHSQIFSKRFQNFARWVVVVVLWLIIGSIAIGRAGIANFIGLTRERDVLIETNLRFKIQNQDLQQTIDKLTHSVKEQERYLKQNFGYAERNEYVFLFSPRPGDG